MIGSGGTSDGIQPDHNKTKLWRGRGDTLLGIAIDMTATAKVGIDMIATAIDMTATAIEMTAILI